MDEETPRPMRRRVESPYLRGQETRARIVATAVRLFGAKGFDSVSTREIALAACVPQPSLRYYFESKAGLYVACLAQIQSAIFRDMEPALTDAEALLDEPNADGERLVVCFCALQAALIDTLIGGTDDGAAALMVIRHDLPFEGGTGDLSGDETGVRRIADCFSRMMVRISGERLDPLSASRIVGLVNGQITTLYLRRDRLRAEGWYMTADRLRWLKSAIRAHTLAILQGYRVQEGGGALERAP